VTKGHDQVHVYTVLLKEAPKDKIDTLDPPTFRHVLRKRLQRAGLGKVPMIGGFEVVYRAKKGVWVLDCGRNPPASPSALPPGLPKHARRLHRWWSRIGSEHLIRDRIIHNRL
jgi:hypothetical protein